MEAREPPRGLARVEVTMDARAPSRGLARVDVAAVGSPAPEALRPVVAALSRAVALPCRLRPDLLRVDPPPLLAERDQWDADRLLAWLERRSVEPGVVLVGVTARDLALPIFTFVFGRARHHGPAAVISLARLAPSFYGLPDDPRLLERRAVAEVLHELGHVAGLRHCARYDCVMHFSADVETIDLRGERFCAACAGGLPGALRGGAR